MFGAADSGFAVRRRASQLQGTRAAELLIVIPQIGQTFSVSFKACCVARSGADEIYSWLP